MNDCLRIEIKKLPKAFGKNRWAIREGDINGATEIHNISKKELIDYIKDEMKQLGKRGE